MLDDRTCELQDKEGIGRTGRRTRPVFSQNGRKSQKVAERKNFRRTQKGAEREAVSSESEQESRNLGKLIRLSKYLSTDFGLFVLV